jgi:diguanylate cyclase (GGDEF)-like protein
VDEPETSSVIDADSAQRELVADALYRAQVYLACARLTEAGLHVDLPDYVLQAGWDWPGSSIDAMTFWSAVELRVRWAEPETRRVQFRTRLTSATMAVWMIRVGSSDWTVIWSASWDEVRDTLASQLFGASEASRAASVLVSSDGSIEWASERFRGIAEHPGALRGLALRDVLPSDMAPAVERLVAEVSAGAVVDRLLPSVQPGPRWLRVRANLAARGDSDQQLVVMQFEEVTDTAQSSERALVDQIVRDPLTDLYNRRALFDIVELDDPDASPFQSVVIIDVRRFRSINDVWGQIAADQCLVAVAGWLRQAASAEDVVVRLVGDQFLVLGSRSSAVVDSVERGGELSVTWGLQQIPVVLQAGWAPRAQGQRLLLAAERAERALEVAKRSATERVIVWNEQIARATSARIAEEESVRKAISAGEITVFFQPLVDVERGAVAGMEALVRLRGSGSGISAERIIAASQQLGLTLELTEQVCARAFAGARELRQVYPDMHVAINISREVMSTGHAIDTVRSAAARAGLPLSAIWIELTEELAVGVSSATLLPELRRGAAMGLAIVIDDFGRGETALSLLRTLPLSGIKLDRSLVPSDNDGRGWRFVEGTASLLRTLAPQLVAEGVETPVQSHRLHQIGVHIQQGYLFGEPQPKEFWLRPPDELPLAVRPRSR